MPAARMRGVGFRMRAPAVQPVFPLPFPQSTASQVVRSARSARSRLRPEFRPGRACLIRSARGPRRLPAVPRNRPARCRRRSCLAQMPTDRIDAANRYRTAAAPVQTAEPPTHRCSRTFPALENRLLPARHRRTQATDQWPRAFPDRSRSDRFLRSECRAADRRSADWALALPCAPRPAPSPRRP